MKRIIGHFFIVCILISLCISCSNERQGLLLEEAEHSIWTKLDSAQIYLRKIDTTLLNSEEMMCYKLCDHYLKLQANRGLDSIDYRTLLSIQSAFIQHNDYSHAGLAAYIVGRSYVFQNNHPLAIHYLKCAEENYQRSSSVLLVQYGVLYSILGCLYEEQQLSEVASEYYEKALPYFIEENDSLLIACTYRDIVKCNSISIDSVEIYSKHALSFCPPMDSLYMLDIRLSLYPVGVMDSAQYVRDVYTICNRYKIFSYASKICEYNLSHNKLDSIPFYLNLLATDTASSIRCKERYYIIRAEYEFSKGNKDAAMDIMRRWNELLVSEVVHSSFDRAYMVEQRFEAEREKQARVEETARKARAYMGLATLSISVVALLVIGGMRWKRKKEQLSLAEERNAMLERELQFKYHQLKHQLRLRIDVSTNLQKELLGNQKLTGKGMLKVIAPMIYINEDQWELLYHDFDEMVSGKLSLLQQNYPALSTMDIRQIILITLDCTTENISLLLNIGNRAVWNRTYRIKEHLNIPVADLKPWLAEYFHLHLSE